MLVTGGRNMRRAIWMTGLALAALAFLTTYSKAPANDAANTATKMPAAISAINQPPTDVPVPAIRTEVTNRAPAVVVIVLAPNAATHAAQQLANTNATTNMATARSAPNMAATATFTNMAPSNLAPNNARGQQLRL